MNNYQIITNVEFVDDFSNEAVASITSNPGVSLAKFVFTDDKPNKNKQRIPKSEFENIIRTGINMPIKMAAGAISDGHENAIPIGVITHLKEENDVVLGLAALWKEERKDEVAQLKAMALQGNKPQLSWELWFDHSNDVDGVEELVDVIVRGTTLVGLPAYSGRTPILALSSVKDQSVEEKQLEDKIAALEKELADLKAEQSVKDTELASLRQYKSAIEQKEAEASKVASIKTKFEQAGISKSESYFEDNKEKLLSMSEAAIEFMLQEMIAFSSAPKAEASVKIPNVPAEKSIDYSNIENIVKSLKEMK